MDSINDDEEVIEEVLEAPSESGDIALFAAANEIYQQDPEKTTTSLLQRKLRIGYSHAARLLDALKEGKSEVEFSLEAQPHGGALERHKKKPDLTGIAYYGDSFLRYQTVPEIRHLIPAFKELYYQRMIADPKAKLTHIVREYNNSINDEGIFFHPNTTSLRQWKKKWDKDILEKKGMMLEVITPEKKVQQVLKTRASQEHGVTEYASPTYETLEEGLQTLGGELMNDAMQMLRDDQELEDIYESDELMKRRTYITNVFAHVTKMVHGKAALLLKASQEKRENAGFLMDLMKKATAGTMSVAEIQALKATYQPSTPAPTPAEHVHVS